ncbi:hypothetical protein [Nocardia abscessus]|uniref:Uncharacterized protein n=1 Tax=Nocardia abscessus TaxID=120957 RepID=A0ABS0C825_9NOCA|nr:hypothetical protein [Nocardia abscessus]MBF6225926.1 hypothetical protein [Nocardia abscessus]
MTIGPHEDDRSIAEMSARFDRGTDRKGPDALIRMGLELALVLVDAAEAAGSLALGRFEHAAARCAQAGIPIEAVHAVLRDSVDAGLSAPATDSPERRAPRDRVEPGVLSEFLEALNSAVARSYAG